MKGMKYRVFSVILALIFSASAMKVFAESSEPVNYDVESAVRKGLNSSIVLRQLDNKVLLGDIKYDIYKSVGNKLMNGQDELSSGASELSKGLSTIDASQDALNAAKIAIANGILPEGAEDAEIIPNVLVIKPGENIVEKITAFNTATGAKLDAAAILASITAKVNQPLTKKQSELDKVKITYEKSRSNLVDGKISLQVAKATVASALAENLDVSSLDGFSADNEASLLRDMAEASITVTAAAKGIYKNQIALMIQNSYYNVLKAQKLLQVKESTMKRAEIQLQNAKDACDAGMKAKDDVLLASIYYTGTRLEYEKAFDDYNNTFVELKKNMNIPNDQAIILEDVTRDNALPMELSMGLESGAKNRLEVVKAEQQSEVYDAYMKLIERGYSSKIKRYQEAEVLQDNAHLELEKVKKDVESSIRESYNTMAAMGTMLETAKDMANEATECLTIAQERYKAGFGVDSSLMKNAGLESSAGTLLEVISAEENLAKVQEKYVEILYGYNLSKAKYLIDIGYLKY